MKTYIGLNWLRVGPRTVMNKAMKSCFQENVVDFLTAEYLSDFQGVSAREVN
jgi:hypothetical protein